MRAVLMIMLGASLISCWITTAVT
eukprot:SAG31_NODE_2240_length_6111_cov_11.710246_1_plen_23_part_10